MCASPERTPPPDRPADPLPAPQFDPTKPAALWLLSFVTSFVLYGYLIPISLYVSLEMVKVVQSLLINLDRAMYHAQSDTPAKACPASPCRLSAAAVLTTPLPF